MSGMTLVASFSFHGDQLGSALVGMGAGGDDGGLKQWLVGRVASSPPARVTLPSICTHAVAHSSAL